MSGPNLQPVLRVVAGTSRQMVRVFTPGVAVPPFSVGTHADWVVEAAGVEPIHFFAAFDGAQLHVSIGSPTAQLSVRLNAVGREWTLAQPPSALVFGEACLALSQEAIPSAAPPPSPSPRTQFIEPVGPRVPVPASPITSPLPARPQPLAGTAMLASPSPNQGGFEPVPAQPRVRSQPVHAGQPAPPPAQAQPSPGWQPQGAPLPHALGSTAKLGSQAAHGGPAPIPETTLASNAPAYAPEPAQPLVPAFVPPAAAAGWGQPEVPAPVPRPQAGTKEPLAVPFDDAGPTTLVDRGALRDHAARIADASPSLTAASTEAYAAKVRALSTAPGAGFPVPEPPPAAPPPAALPQVGSTPPPAAHGAGAPQPAPGKAAKPPSKLVAEWRRASWLMRAMIVLFPLGAYVSIWTPGEDDPISNLIRGDRAPESNGSAKHASPGPSQQAAKLAASAALASASSASRAGGAPSARIAAASADSASPSPVASVAAPQGSSSSEPAVASLEAAAKQRPTPTASKATPAEPADGAPSDAPNERAAIDAAFQGRMAEAASLYDGLSKGPNAALFSLAARLVRADSVRKPAISH